MSRRNRSKHHPTTTNNSSNEIIDQLNIRYRVCHVFTPHTNKSKEGSRREKICECGLPESKHIASRPSNSQWNIESNTLEKINAKYGITINNSLYVCLAPDTPLTKVERILLEAWKIPKPRFIVSIIGGAKYFKLDDRLETNFINGIVEIAQKSDAWLLTNGFNTGIVQLVGQAIRIVKLTNPDQKITAIGICKWGCISNIKAITGLTNGEKENETVDVEKKNEYVGGKSELEMNHSHYLMVDDGTINYYDLKDYRTKLAIHMARLEYEDDITIPAVTLVVEGGKDTISNIYYDLRKNVPVVLVVGSGRAADFMSRWLMYTKDLENEAEDYAAIHEISDLDNINQNTKHNSNSSARTSASLHFDFANRKLEQKFRKYEEHLKEDIKNVLLPKAKDSNLEESMNLLIKQIQYCLQPGVRSDITVFNLNTDTNISETILRSICQSRQKLSKRKMNDRDEDNEKQATPKYQQRKHIEEQNQNRIREKEVRAERTRLLQLAMDWDCIDIAKEFIFQSSLDNILSKNAMFLIALKKNLPLFVYEFLKLGIDYKEIFFRKSDLDDGFQYKYFLEKLYDPKAVNHNQTHLKEFVHGDEDSKKQINSIDALNRTLNTLIGDYMYELYYDTLEIELDDRKKRGLINPNKRLTDEDINEKQSDYLLRDLFLWAILMNYIHMAIVILSFMKYRICPSLIATKILKEYYKIASYGDLKRKYLESAKYFEQYAMKCLDDCDDHNPKLSDQILFQRNELYGYITCLQVASIADDKPFLAHSCSVKAVQNTWYDKIRPVPMGINEGTMYFFFGFISLGFLAPFFVDYRTTKEKFIGNENYQRVRRNGINYCDPTQLEYEDRSLLSAKIKYYFIKFIKFHQALPMKFFYHLMVYIFFLLLFSYVLLFNFNRPTNQIPSIHWTEILTIILVSCMLIEEIRFFFSQENLSFEGKLTSYFGQHLKKMTFLGLLLFYIGLILRFTTIDSETNFTAARIVMALDLEIWWLRSLWFIMVLPFLGPYLVSIGKMLKDLTFFLVIIAIVMTAYGVASCSMVYYPAYNGFTTREADPIDNSFDGRSIFRFIIYPVYFMMYGSIQNELDDLDSNKNAGWSIATQVLLSFHTMIVNVLLINLLIAMFSKRFDEVYDDIHNIWHSQQYILTREYYIRAPLIPPISLFYDIWYLAKKFYFFIRRTCLKETDDFGARAFQIIPVYNRLVQEWSEFEEGATYEYAHDQVRFYTSNSEKSTTGLESSDGKKQELNMKKDDNENNGTIEGLNDVEEQLISLNALVEEMRETIRTQKKTN